MENLIPLPQKVSSEKGSTNNEAIITVEPCYPGYGTTLGNALRRVLLSSMPGSAIVSAKIKNVSHEFSTLPGVKEDMVELMLNLKTIRVALHEDGPVTLNVQVKGEKTVTSKDIKAPSSVEISNPDQLIATLTDKSAELDMELIVRKGKGYVPAELQEDGEDKEIGTIQLDAAFSPIKNVNFQVEHVRVGEITNFDKLILAITTDGTVVPEDAFMTASAILVEHYSLFSESFSVKQPAKKSKKKSA